MSGAYEPILVRGGARRCPAQLSLRKRAGTIAARQPAAARGARRSSSAHRPGARGDRAAAGARQSGTVPDAVALRAPLPRAATRVPSADPQTADDAGAIRQIREILNRAARNLSTVNYGALTDEGRVQYDTAKRFMQQGEDALTTRNYIYALSLADKADTIAKQLLGR
ncbi:MAG: hypothetical protein LC804_27295 [Acidobacteria bacterium]|nr:hypothetical protein [Acidobacteriota bacterium]